VRNRLGVRPLGSESPLTEIRALSGTWA
jgi:hypothetical protein